MSWGRGFFRIWMIVSGIWIAVWLFEWQGSEVDPNAGSYMRNPFEAEARLIDAEIRGTIPRYEKCLTAEGVKKVADVKEDAVSARILRCMAYVDLWRSRIELFAIAVIPPPFLLLTGLLMAWVVAGFRTGHNAKTGK